MSLGTKRDGKQHELWIAREAMRDGPAHVFYDALNTLLQSIGFDDYVEALCAPYYADKGRRSIPPGTYFRMTLIGYFENISSQRGIAWRCQDSLSLRRFLGVELDESTPVHASMTVIRQRLPLEVHQAVFDRVLQACAEHKLLGGTLAVDSTTLEANAAMRSIERRDTHEDYAEFVERLMREAGELEDDETPSAEERARFDRQRKGKTLSNADWSSRTDPDARVMKMKDGRTRLGYKAEHAVDLESDLIVSAEVHPGDHSDAASLAESVVNAAARLKKTPLAACIEAVVADKGYHSLEQLGVLEHLNITSYLATPKHKGRHRWVDKAEGDEGNYRRNARRNATQKGRALQRSRSEQVERSFAQVCTTGGARRTWLRGLESINKRYLLVAMAHNLATVLRELIGAGKPREYAEAISALFAAHEGVINALCAVLNKIKILTPNARWLIRFTRNVFTRCARVLSVRRISV